MDRSGRVESGLSGLSGRVCISAAGARPRVRSDLLLPAGHPRLLGQQQRPARRPAFLGRGWHSSEPPGRGRDGSGGAGTCVAQIHNHTAVETGRTLL